MMDGTAKPNTDVAGVSPAERRRHERVGVMLMASLRSTNGIFDCMVLDISRGGAKLILGEPQALPPSVTLMLGGFGSFRAQTVWQHNEILGIRFTDTPEAIAEAFQGLVP
jgi:hypothetical protein